MDYANHVAAAAHEISRKGFEHEFGRPKADVKDQALWEDVRRLGTRLWLDTGDLDVASELWCRQFEALTTNNTLLNKEIQKGIYDDLITEAACAIGDSAPEIDKDELILEIAFVLNARHGLRLVQAFDAYVSVELHTDLGNDIERSIAYGKRYHRICPERFYVKVPLTPAGLIAARKLGQTKVPVNFTLGFSARQGYAAALISQPRYANVFMGRLNAFVADNNLGDGKNVGEKATLATQREILKLRDAGKTETRLIGASMRESSQVATLAGLDVFTMPPKVAAGYLENPPKDISRQVEEDPSIDFADGVTAIDYNAATLWEVTEAFKNCVAGLLKRDIGRMSADDLQAHFEDAGFADFLPRWSEQDIRTAADDGKIPVFEKWKARLASGEIGVDALMNLSAFHSFATDQKALDARIESLL
ncbi:MAG: transaldolase family protein [Planctomycetota bacterium]|jgi:transaldolase